jgi:hypothetical protein
VEENTDYFFNVCGGTLIRYTTQKSVKQQYNKLLHTGTGNFSSPATAELFRRDQMRED